MEQFIELSCGLLILLGIAEMAICHSTISPFRIMGMFAISLWAAWRIAIPSTEIHNALLVTGLNLAVFGSVYQHLRRAALKAQTLLAQDGPDD
jgi:hypothetical protein